MKVMGNCKKCNLVICNADIIKDEYNCPGCGYNGKIARLKENTNKKEWTSKKDYLDDIISINNDL